LSQSQKTHRPSWCHGPAVTSDGETRCGSCEREKENAVCKNEKVAFLSNKV